MRIRKELAMAAAMAMAMAMTTMAIAMVTTVTMTLTMTLPMDKPIATLLDDPIFEVACEEMPDVDKSEYPGVAGLRGTKGRTRKRMADIQSLNLGECAHKRT